MNAFLTYLSGVVDVWIFAAYSIGLVLTTIGGTFYVMIGKKVPTIETITKLVTIGAILMAVAMIVPSGTMIEDIIFAGLLN